MTQYAIGIDIGGSKISVALGNSKGKILAKRVVSTWTGAKTQACIQELTATLSKLIREAGISKKKILGIGVGCPGAVNTEKGVLPRSPNLPGWAGLPLKSILKKATGFPVFIANDANAAALGENVFGAGKNAKDFIYITVSTGVGGGIVIHEKLYEGISFVAGEIGHMSIVPDGIRCKCGKKGCLEAYASGTAIAGFFCKQANKSCKNISAREVGFAARQGNKAAVESYKRAGYFLGIGIANLLNVLNPGKVVIGGGVLKSAHKIFWLTMMKSAKQHAWPEAFRATKIVRSRLGDSVGDLGAIALVFKNLELGKKD